jgi:hypothetical protein
MYQHLFYSLLVVSLHVSTLFLGHLQSCTVMSTFFCFDYLLCDCPKLYLFLMTHNSVHTVTDHYFPASILILPVII